MPIKIVRNDAGNCITFEGSSNPVYWNSCLSGEVAADDSQLVNVVNDIRSDDNDTFYEFFHIPYTEFRDANNNTFADASAVASYITLNGNVASGTDVSVGYKGGWDASTNTPDLTDSAYSASNGDWYYVVTEGNIDPNTGVDDSQSQSTYRVNDIIKYTAATDNWTLIPNETVRVDQLEQEVNEIVHGTTSVLSVNNSSVYADGDAGKADPNGTSGWYYRNLETGVGKINWYYVGNQNAENTMTLGTLKGMYALIEVRNDSETPFFSVYTNRKNDGNDISWYRSRKTFAVSGALDAYSDSQTSSTVVLYWGEDPTDFRPELNHVELTLDSSTSIGFQSTDEDILFAALSTSSGKPEGSYEFVVQQLGYTNSTHRTSFVLDADSVSTTNEEPSTDVQSSLAVNFLLDATNTSVLVSLDGKHYGVNTITAVVEDDGTITIKGHGESGEDLITNLNHELVQIAGSAVGGNIQSVVNALNSLFQVDPLGGGVVPPTVLPTLDGVDVTYNLAEGQTPVTYDPVDSQQHLYTTGTDTGSGHGARLWSNETIDQSGEYFDVEMTGQGRFILGLVETSSVDYTNLSNNSGNAHSGLLWGQAFYDYGSYTAPWTIYGSSPQLSYGPGWNGATTTQMRYNTEVQDNFNSMNVVRFRVGINNDGYIYCSYYDAGRSNEYIVTSRRGLTTPDGNYALVIKCWNGNTTIVDVPERVAEDDDSQAVVLTYRYIESPDGSFHHPLFVTQEEANYLDTLNGGSGTSTANNYIDEPTFTTWYMPDTGGYIDDSQAPSNTDLISYTEIPTNADANYAPTAFSGNDQTFDENVSVNIQITPQDVTWTTSVSGLPSGLTYNAVSGNIQGTTRYVPESETHTVTITRTNNYGSSSGSFDLTISDNASLGDLSNFTETYGNFVQPDRAVLTHDFVMQYDTTLSPGEQLTYSYTSIPPTIGILNTTGQTNLDAFDSTTDTLGATSTYNFAETDKWDLRYVSFGGYVGANSTKHNLVGWDDNSIITGNEGTNVNVEFKLEYSSSDNYIRLYRGGVLLKTSASTFSGPQTLTFAGFDDQAQTDLYVPANLTISTIGAGTTTAPTGFESPILTGEMGSTTLLGNPDGVDDSAVQITDQLEVNHRFIFPKSWIEANVLPYVQDDNNDVYIGIADSLPSWGDVGSDDFDILFKIEGTANSTHYSKLKTSLQDYASVTVNSLTDAFYDYALEWDGEDLHVIACNIGDINTQPGISDGGTFARVMTYSGYGTATGTTGQPLDIVIGVDNNGQVNLTTSGLQHIRIPFSSNTILVGESSSGNGQFGQVSSTYFDLGGQHAPGALSFNAPTVNAGYTYTFIYHPSMEATDFIEFRLASDNTTVYTTGVTTFDNTTGGDPAYTDRYKGVTFAVPSDAPPLKVYHYNSYQSGYYDAGRDLPISGSTYVETVTGITLEGPAANQTGTNVMDSGDHGWISLDETLAAGERLVLDNAFFTDFLAEVMDTNNIFAIGLKGDNWTNTKEVNNQQAATSGEFFKGNTYIVGVCSSGGTQVTMTIISNGSVGNSMLINTASLQQTVCAFIDITSSGNNIRMGFGRNGNHGVTQGDESTVAYADWNSYKGQTGDQGYGITSLDVVMSFWTYDGGAIDGDEIDWTGLSEIAVPTPAATLTTNWTKALDFSGSSERTLQVNNSNLYTPLKMSGINNNVPANPQAGYTSNDSNSRPWATTIVFNSDGNSSNQHIWNLGEGAGSTDDNIYLRVDASGNLYFGWGRSSALNECHLSYFGTISSGTWYGIYIASTGERLGGTYTASDIAGCFDIRMVNLSTGAAGSNFSTAATWTSGSFGYRMNREFLGSMTIGGRDANRNFHGKVAAMVVTTLRTGVVMPTDAEISMMVRDPQQWLTDYKVGNSYRRPGVSTDTTNFQLGNYDPASSTQVWLMGDGTSDAYAQIRNQVFATEQNRYPMNMISMVSADIETVSINGLT